MRVLVCEPYFGGSHRAWAEGYAAASRHDVGLVTHPGTFWKWRMQGAAVTLAKRIEADVAEHGRPDVLVVSDMVNVPALLGLARRVLGDIPVVVYFHENQLTYPSSDGTTGDLTYGMTNWLSAAAADLVLFNSEYHRAAFFAALPSLLRGFPDQTHTRHVDDVETRSEVLPVGIDDALLDAPRRTDSAAPLVLWNQRWEYDKDPARFFAAAYRLADEGVPFRVALAGENFRNHPIEFDEGVRRLAERVVHAGWLERPAYVELLAASDVVVSTARHEFFGVSVAEAIAAGAFPVVPAALSYPEVVPAAHHDACLYDNDSGLDERWRRAVTDGGHRASVTAAARPAMRCYAWSQVAPRYDDRLETLTGAVRLNRRSQPITEAP